MRTPSSQKCRLDLAPPLADRFILDCPHRLRPGTSPHALRIPANVALFYAASSPTLLFNQAVQQVAKEQGRSLSENARALAVMNIAMNDSLVASFLNKYHYNFWRPETAIHAGDTDGNRKTDPDPSFVPFVTTPCFPSYPSNHGSTNNGAAEISETHIR
jgi:hypothetical protein